MFKRLPLLFGFVLSAVCCERASAQIPTYADNIAQIFYDNCVSCHRPGSIAPFSLMTYPEASAWAVQIAHEVNDRHMPPWPPDSHYQNYAHDRSLSPTEIQLINDWVLAGAPSGDLNQAPPAPVFDNSTFLSGTPDMVLQIPTYTSKAVNRDDYVCFSIPTHLLQDRFLKAIEVVPGNPEIVHHVLVFKDDAGTYQTDTLGQCTGPIAGMLTGYAPGEMPMVFPNGGTVRMGVRIKSGSNIILAMHYPMGSAGMKDSTKVHLYFYPQGTPGIREVTTLPVLQKGNFCIQPNTIDTLTVNFPGAMGLNTNYSVLSIFPHAHLLARQMLVYALTATGDTIPLIRIPNWDFHWQGFYLFKNIVKLPTGARVFGHFVYDNTTGNPNNPNSPPQQVCAGLNTTDEMFLVYMQYLSYQPGDENIDLEALTTFTSTGLDEPPVGGDALEWSAFPNPFGDWVYFEYRLETRTSVRLDLFDNLGRLVHTVCDAEQDAGLHGLRWQTAGTPLSEGWYTARLQAGERVSVKKLLWR